MHAVHIFSLCQTVALLVAAGTRYAHAMILLLHAQLQCAGQGCRQQQALMSNVHSDVKSESMYGGGVRHAASR
jgi:hypothetical protein